LRHVPRRTALEGDRLRVAGGRVVMRHGARRQRAHRAKRAYEAIAHTHFEGMQYRHDIGHHALKRAPSALDAHAAGSAARNRKLSPACPGYDASSRHETPLRLRTIDLLHLAPGARVLDVACGTGLSFAALAARVGTGGRVVGVEVSPRWRTWRASGSRAKAGLPSRFASVISRASILARTFSTPRCFTTPTMCCNRRRHWHAFSPACVQVRALQLPGLKTTHPLLVPLNLSAWVARPRYRTTDANLRRPWIHLLRWVPDFTWQATYLGTGYIGSGTVR